MTVVLALVVLGSGFSPMIQGESGLLYYVSDEIDLTGAELVAYVRALDRVAKETAEQAPRFSPIRPDTARIAAYGTPVYIMPGNMDCELARKDTCVMEEGQKVCRSITEPGKCRGAYYWRRGLIQIAYNRCAAASSLAHELIHRILHVWFGIVDFHHDKRSVYYGPNSIPQRVLEKIGCD